MKVAAFKMYWTVTGSVFLLMTIYTLYRVILVTVLKRVIEIDEDLMLRIITISVFGVMATTMICLIPGYRFNTIVSVVSGHQIAVSVFSCHQNHPMTQE